MTYNGGAHDSKEFKETILRNVLIKENDIVKTCAMVDK